MDSSSAAASFVEGGMQDAFEDLCSICLELFSDRNPITVTTCKHGYHLQCILEWAQRSKECPMCWKRLGFEDSCSQELLDAVELERHAILSPSAVRRPPTGGSELHQGSAFLSDADFEQRILHHLAEAATVHFSRHESILRRGLSTHDQLQHVMVPHSMLSSTVGPDVDLSLLTSMNSSREHSTLHTHSPDQIMAIRESRTDAGRADRDSSRSPFAEENQQKSTLSEIFSIPDSVKSRFAAASLKYKETFTRTTRGLKDMLGTQGNDIGACARDMSAGVARMLERIASESYVKKQRDEGASVMAGSNGCERSSSSSGGEAGKNVGLSGAGKNVGLSLDQPNEGRGERSSS